MKNKLAVTSILTAITASLCCITPVLALIAGTSGVASTFSWIEPFRPYLIGLTILVLLFAWYQKLKPEKEIDCECETDKEPKFMQSKTFLGIVTAFAIVMLAFPYYSSMLYPKTEKQIIIVDKSNIKTIEYKIQKDHQTMIKENDMKKDIDSILDKINNEGFDSLSGDEQERLYKGSQSLSQNKKKD